MREFVVSLSIMAMLAIGMTGCNDKKESNQGTNDQSFENFAHKPKDTSADDRSPIRYQK